MNDDVLLVFRGVMLFVYILKVNIGFTNSIYKIVPVFRVGLLVLSGCCLNVITIITFFFCALVHFGGTL